LKVFSETTTHTGNLSVGVRPAEWTLGAGQRSSTSLIGSTIHAEFRTVRQLMLAFLTRHGILSPGTRSNPSFTLPQLTVDRNWGNSSDLGLTGWNKQDILPGLST
jgi:hypothetical protein